MDPELIALAAAGGTAIVEAMATDAWSMAKSKIIGFFQSRQVEADDTLDRIDDRRDMIRRTGNDEKASLQLWKAERHRWSGTLERVLNAEPGSRKELEDLVAELTALHKAAGPMVARQRVSANRDAYVAGRDQHIVVDNRESVE